jgi:predicted ATPase
MSYGPFGDLLRQYIARKHGLTQTRLAHLVGYDQAVLTRMSQGKKDLTGPSGRERVVQIIAALRDEGVLSTQAEANALLKAGGMPPLYAGRPTEAALLSTLKTGSEAAIAAPEPTPQLLTNPYRTVSLSAQLSSFIGREHEIVEVMRLLGTTRLLTLTGSGGAGKTRLAIEVGATLAVAPLAHTVDRATASAKYAPTFRDGVWLVELAPLTDARLVPDLIATILGLTGSSRPALEVLVDHLAPKRVLLLLDNCEHLIQACAEVVVALLRACPDLHVLATSREALKIPGEVTWRVPSLAMDEALQLFAERARAAKPGFILSPANTATVTQICQRLDSMPLAIELAAARLRSFSVEQIAARLDDAFRLLTGGSRVALPRQQTLQATIDWSYNLLPEEECSLLRQLSVFAGGWTLEAVESIHGAGALEWLDQLVNKSLVVDEAVASESDSETSETRYRLLETIRQYARGKFAHAEKGEYEQARQRHLEYFASLAQTAKPYLHGPEQVQWLDRLEREMDNLRAALEWSAQTKDVSHGEQLIDGIGLMWAMRGHCIEGSKWIEAVLPADLTGPNHTRVTACIVSGWAATYLGASARAIADFTEAVSLAHQLEDQRLIIQANLGLGSLTINDEQAETLLLEGMRLAHEGGWRWEELYALATISDRVLVRDDADRQAKAMANEALAGFRSLGDAVAVAIVLNNQGQPPMRQGDDALARLAFEECVVIGRRLRSQIMIADGLIGLAIVGLHEGDEMGTMNAIRESIPIYQIFGNLVRVGQCVSVAAGIAYLRGDLRCAAKLLAAADKLIGSDRWPDMRLAYNRCLPDVRDALDPADFDRAWAEGQKMTVKEAIALALAV